ncbi:uncharacterized protein LOC143286560 [Babylonia areolata]|uniref:uncharacterized protein LOC143286560 n=1 Tax=Babylonia areolata TaxID=304850 RepID=UPI003FD5A133
MPPKRRRGAAKGKQKQDKPESLETSREDMAGEEEEGETGDDSLLEDKTAGEESVSELEMSVDDKNLEEKLLETTEEENKGSVSTMEEEDSGLKVEENQNAEESNKEEENKKMETGEELGDQRTEETSRNAESMKEDSQKDEDDSKKEEDKGAKAAEDTTQKTDSKVEDDAGQEKKPARVGLLETPESRHPETAEPRSVKMVPLASFEVQEMRSRWKWSIRISPVKPEDILTSNLMTMPKVQDSYYYMPQNRDGNGQMELCTKTTNDTILAMIRVLRTPFVSGTITVELTKRAFIRMGKKEADVEMTTEEGENEEKKREEEKKEEEIEELDEEPAGGERSGLGPNDEPVTWGEAKETAAFVVNLHRIHKINLRVSRKLKGDVIRRSVYVGSLPKSTTEEILKVVFPIANSIIMKPADDPNMRHSFLETSNHANAVGFVASYLGLKVNGQEVKLSVRAPELNMLKNVPPEGKKQVKKEEDETEEEKNKGDDKMDKKEEEETEGVEMKSVQENGEEKDEKTEDTEKAEGDNVEKKEESEKTKEDNIEKKEESEKKEGGKVEGKKMFREFTEEEKQQRAELNRQKKKRKREFMEEMAREWSTKRSRHDHDMPGPPFSMGPRFPFGPPAGRGGMFPPMGPMAPPLFQVQDKVASLLRLQNQLEKTISTQMEFIQQSEAAARQQAEMRMREMAMMSQDFVGMGKGNSPRGRGGFHGMSRGGGSTPPGGKFSGIVGRSFGGSGNKGGKQRDFHRSPSNSESFDSQSQGGGFAKRFRKESDSRYEPVGSFGDSKGGNSFQGGNQGNTYRAQKKFGQGGKAFGNNNANTSFGSGGFGGDDSSMGNQFGNSSLGRGGNFGGGKNKFGRGGKFGGGGNQIGGGNFGNETEDTGFGGNQIGGSSYGGNEMGSGSFGGGNQMGGGKFKGGGNQRGAGKFGNNKKFGGRGGKFGGSGNQMGGGNNFGGSGNKFSPSGNKAGGAGNYGGSANQAGNVSSFGGGAMNTATSNYGGTNAYGGNTTFWGASSSTTNTSTTPQNYSGGNFGSSNYGSDMTTGTYSGTNTSGNFGSYGSGSMMGTGLGTGTTSFGATANYNTAGQQQTWNYGQNQTGRQQW